MEPFPVFPLWRHVLTGLLTFSGIQPTQRTKGTASSSSSYSLVVLMPLSPWTSSSSLPCRCGYIYCFCKFGWRLAERRTIWLSVHFKTEIMILDTWVRYELLGCSALVDWKGRNAHRIWDCLSVRCRSRHKICGIVVAADLERDCESPSPTLFLSDLVFRCRTHSGEWWFTAFAQPGNLHMYGYVVIHEQQVVDPTSMERGCIDRSVFTTYSQPGAWWTTSDKSKSIVAHLTHKHINPHI